MEASKDNVIYINDKPFPLNGQKNLLETIRQAGFHLPTFCYRADLSVYGACRMCVVEIDGKGVQASCTVKPEPGMRVKINTERTQRVRRIALELLLANHNSDCTTCQRSGNCDLQTIAQNMGVKEVRFPRNQVTKAVDDSNPSVVRDPNKCILCGACVRMCREIQGKNVINFAYRGAKTVVAPAYEKPLSKVDCTFCGQCVAVCPTGALRIKNDIERVWKNIHDTKKKVVAQIAPAVRVAIGEEFGIPPGKDTLKLIVAALKHIGFDKVFDTTFAADLTIMEEAAEFVERFKAKKDLPLLTSCCPAWVRLVEQKFPRFIGNLSTCRSPQQMFGSLAKNYFAKEYGIAASDLCVVSIMPCTAKKAEADREEFAPEGIKDVDIVLTTQELIGMIKQASIDFQKIQPEELDAPFGVFSGAGMIFGASGGVAEAAVRTAHTLITGEPLKELNIDQARGLKTLKELNLKIKDIDVKVAVVNTLGEADRLLQAVQDGKVNYDMIEVMACPGGCIAGAGQPYSIDCQSIKEGRIKGIYAIDEISAIRNSHENPEVLALYEKWLQKPNSDKAHEFLHTHYRNRRRIDGQPINVTGGGHKTDICVCVGTSCYIKGAYNFIEKANRLIKENGWEDKVNIRATFCFENCQKGPNIKIDGKLVPEATADKAEEILKQYVFK
jgi:NADH-quinone oxidoreductase subunit G